MTVTTWPDIVARRPVVPGGWGKVYVAVKSGQKVVYCTTTSVVTLPTGQFVTVSGQEVMVWTEVVVMVEVISGERVTVGWFEDVDDDACPWVVVFGLWGEVAVAVLVSVVCEI
jgi:DNA-binding beta-propeller fold protein YncE